MGLIRRLFFALCQSRSGQVLNADSLRTNSTALHPSPAFGRGAGGEGRIHHD